MKTINAIISENIYNQANIEKIREVCESVAQNNGIRAEVEGSEMFLYGYEQKDVDPTDVRNEILTELQKVGF